MGSDPTKVDPAAFDEVIAKLQKAVDDGQIRQFTGNDYAPLLAKGDIWAAMAWSGDLVQLQPDNPNLKFAIPATGGAIATDTMVIPLGGNVAGASTFMNFFYDPAIMAQVEAYVNYVRPVKGTKEAIGEIDPALAENQLIFPTRRRCRTLYAFDPAALENPELPGEVAGRDRGVTWAPRGVIVLHRRRWLTPYLLLAPGLAFLPCSSWCRSTTWRTPRCRPARSRSATSSTGRGRTTRTRSRRTRSSSSARSSTRGSRPSLALLISYPLVVLDRRPRRAVEEPAAAVHRRARSSSRT